VLPSWLEETLALSGEALAFLYTPVTMLV
jgi:hypothetical protein